MNCIYCVSKSSTEKKFSATKVVKSFLSLNFKFLTQYIQI